MHSLIKVNCPELYIGISTIYMDFTIYELRYRNLKMENKVENNISQNE